MKKPYNQGFLIPLIIIIVAALAIGGGVYVHHKNVEKAAEVSAMASTTDSMNGTSPSSTSGQATSSINISGTASTGTIRSLLALNKNVLCTISTNEASHTSTGTVYISGNQMAGDFTTTSSASGSMTSHIIKNGNDVYAWSGSQGAKITMDQMTSPTVTSKSNVTIDQNVTYKCTPWTPDTSKFTIPTTVKFMDVSAIMKANTSVGTGTSVNGTVNANVNTRANVNIPANVQAQINAAESASMNH